MQFELKKYNRDITDDDLIEDLKRVANQLGKQTLTSAEYNQSRINKYAAGTISRRLKGWNNALEKAGLFAVFHHIITDEELLDDLKKVHEDVKPNKLTQEIYSKLGKYGSRTINDRFGWNKALKSLGLEISNEYKIPEDELFKNLEEVWIKLGRQPGKRDMIRSISKYSEGPYLKRFGSWQLALQAFVNFINTEELLLKEQVVTQNDSTEKQQKKIKIHQTKRDINLRLRFLVMRRDNFKCVICGRSPATDPKIILHVDHIIPWEKGGETVIENLQTLCSDDNLGKSNLSMYPDGKNE